MCAEKFPLVSMGGRAEGLACADPGARTPIAASGNLESCFNKPSIILENYYQKDLYLYLHIHSTFLVHIPYKYGYYLNW